MSGATGLSALSWANSSGQTFSFPLTGWWEASYAGSPWVGKVSSGTSGSNNATEGTQPPATGAAVNGFTPADFDGSNDLLTAGGTVDTYVAALAVSGWALVWVDAASNQANPINNGPIIYDSGNNSIAVSFRSTPLVYFSLNGGSSGGGTSVSRAYSTGAWQFITFRYNGTNIQVGVNEAPGAAGGGATAAYSTNIGNLTNTMRMGTASVLAFDGKALSVGITDQVLTDANFTTDIKGYLNTRYALSL